MAAPMLFSFCEFLVWLHVTAFVAASSRDYCDEVSPASNDHQRFSHAGLSWVVNIKGTSLTFHSYRFPGVLNNDTWKSYQTHFQPIVQHEMAGRRSGLCQTIYVLP